MKQVEFPVLRLLLEDDDGEDIVSGLRKVISDLRLGWSSDVSGVEKIQKGYWNKMSPAQQKNQTAVFSKLILNQFDNPGAPISVNGFHADSKDEASFVAATCNLLALQCKMINLQILLAESKHAGWITNEEYELMKGNVEAGPSGRELPLSKDSRNFLSGFKSQLVKMLVVQEGTLGFNIPVLRHNIITALQKTASPDEEGKKPIDMKTVVNAMHYLFLHMGVQFSIAHKQFAEQFKREPSKFGGSPIPEPKTEPAPKPGAPAAPAKG